jgi:hypothetical protein
MNVGTLLLYLVFPAIFLGVATLTPGKIPVLRLVCIALAYFSLAFLDSSICAATAPAIMTADAVPGKDTSPFGVAFLIVSVWAFALVGAGDKTRKEDNSR